LKLLVADGDADLVEMLTSWLRTRGYQVKYALSAERIRFEWIEQEPDLVIVNTTIKGVDALGLCRELRSTHDALVLALGSTSDIGMQIRCLEAGADAYLVKPFLPAQLMAHIHALSRRVRGTLLRHPSSILTVGPLCVDSLRNEVSVSGTLKRLTPTESKLLHLLAVNANDVCTLDQIVAHVWGYGEQSDTTLIKAHIRHLREKIERDPSRPCYIVTVAGSGYMLVRQPDQRVSDSPEEPIRKSIEFDGLNSDRCRGLQSATTTVTSSREEASQPESMAWSGPAWNPAVNGHSDMQDTSVFAPGW
jgi:DNA-binding response OmpR family regulator